MISIGFLFFWPLTLLVPPRQGGTVPSAVEVLSLNHWTAREIPTISILMKQIKRVVG